MIDQKGRGFEIFAIHHNIVVAMYTGDYLMVLNTIHQLYKEGWFGQEATKIN